MLSGAKQRYAGDKATMNRDIKRKSGAWGGGVPLLLTLPPIGEHLLESRRPRAYALGDRTRDRCFYPCRVEEVAACADKPAMMERSTPEIRDRPLRAVGRPCDGGKSTRLAA